MRDSEYTMAVLNMTLPEKRARGRLKTRLMDVVREVMGAVGVTVAEDRL